MSQLANQDPLAQLNDIIAPTAPSGFPPAPIYWVISLITIAIIIIAYYVIKNKKQHQKIQKTQLLKLKQLQQQQESFIALNQLLKGCALSYFDRNEVASLHGEQWFNFLQQYSTFPIFDSKEAFLQRLYQTENQLVDESDYIAAKNWISTLPKQIKKHNKKQGIKDV